MTAFTFQLRRDTAAVWSNVNPVLAAGEPGFETDTGRLKIGDGTRTWSQLGYVGAAPVRPVLIVSGSGTGQTIAGAFSTLVMSAVAVDTSGGWNAASSTWSVPETGIYAISAKLRAVDNAPAGVGFGLGADIANGDGPDFLWAQTNAAPRQGHQLYRLAKLTVGDRLRAFAYADGNLGVLTTSLSAARVA